ncbi:MAG: hypothetical protein PQJ46_05960, partial [Spirochaetales bacterium]|nr:hypothetical protein [Spirochaetales bacterium]
MFKKCVMSILFFIAITLSTFGDTPRFLINNSHTNSISAIEYSELSNTLVTAGNDGKLKVWGLPDGKLEYQLQASYTQIRKMAISQSGSYAAIISSDGINVVELSVWNWKTGKKLFSKRLKEVPLFITFSPKGTFLVYGKTDWNSLVFLNAKTGSKRYPIREGFGIVSSAFISNSEKTLLTYNSSGSIQYWDLKNGKRKTKIPTTPDLKNISFTSSGRYMTGYDG